MEKISILGEAYQAGVVAAIQEYTKQAGQPVPGMVMPVATAPAARPTAATATTPLPSRNTVSPAQIRQQAEARANPPMNKVLRTG